MEWETTSSARSGPVTKRRREPESEFMDDEIPRSIVFTPTATQRVPGYYYDTFDAPELFETVGRIMYSGFSMVPYVEAKLYGPYVSNGALYVSITVKWDSRKADEEAIATCARQVVMKPIVEKLDEFITLFMQDWVQPLPPAPTAATFVNPIAEWTHDMQGVDADVFAARPV